MSVFKRNRDSFGNPKAQTPTRQSPLAPPPPAKEAPLPPARETPFSASSRETPLSPARETTPPPPAPVASPQAEAPRQALPVVRRDAAAIIDRNSQLTGTLRSTSNILIEGAFEGEIEAKETVLVEKDAQAQGTCSAKEVVVSGTYDGKIICQSRLQITSSASIKGDVKTPVLVIEEGAIVNCCFEMSRPGR